MRPADRFKTMVERLLPWYDPAVEAKRDIHTEAVRQDSIAARIRSEPVIAEYAAADKRLPRRGRAKRG